MRVGSAERCTGRRLSFLRRRCQLEAMERVRIIVVSRLAPEARECSCGGGGWMLRGRHQPKRRCSCPIIDAWPDQYALPWIPLSLSRRLCNFCIRVLTRAPLRPLQTLAVDLLNPTAASQARSHKLKRLVQNPNSFFMDVKCPGCFAITTVFSHAQTVVVCSSCAQVLCQPTGGKGRLTEGCSFRRKN